MGLFKKLTNTVSQLGSEVTKTSKGMLNYKSPEEIAQERSKRADKIRILVQCPDGSDLEVYDDFIIGYPTQGSLGMGALKAVAGLNETVFPMMIMDVTISFKEPEQPTGNRRLLLTAKAGTSAEKTIGFVISPENEQAINNVCDYIRDFQKNPKKIDDDPALEYKFPGYAASAKTFPLLGLELQVSEEIDAYNQFQELYRKLAWNQAQKAKRAMARRILSYETYHEFLSDIVYEYGLPLFELTLDICMANDVYSENEESIFKMHYNMFHNLEKRMNAIASYAQQVSTSGAHAGANAAIKMNYSQTTAVFGTSRSELNKAVRKANFSNMMTDARTKLMSNMANHLTPKDKENIYEKFDAERDGFTDAIFQDFWGMCLTLNKILEDNGHTVWSKVAIDDTELRTIENMSRPDFPEEKIPGFIIPLLQKNPYDQRIYSFLVNRYGKTDEISAIMDYFHMNN